MALDLIAVVAGSLSILKTYRRHAFRFPAVHLNRLTRATISAGHRRSKKGIPSLGNQRSPCLEFRAGEEVFGIAFNEFHSVDTITLGSGLAAMTPVTRDVIAALSN